MISLILITIAAIFKAIMDKSAINHFSKVWWNKSQSWTAKWAVGLPIQERKLWYYGWIYTPKYKERFIYSSTILVFLTDGWHFSQFLFLTFLFSGIVMYSPVIWVDKGFIWGAISNYALFRLCFNVTFQTIYQFVKF